MIVGNLAALSQTDMKRLLAYSGIAQVGYIVAAFAGQTPLGMRYAIFYLAAYTFMNLGAFAVVALMSRDADATVGVGRFAGLAYRRPWLAAAMTFFLLGLAGLPPTAGFTGKILILASSVNAGYAWLAVVLILGTAISIYVYFKIVRVMFVRVDEAHVRDERSVNALPWVTSPFARSRIFALGLVPLTPSNVLPLILGSVRRSDRAATRLRPRSWLRRGPLAGDEVFDQIAGIAGRDADADREHAAPGCGNVRVQHRAANAFRDADRAFERRVFEDDHGLLPP